MFGIFSPCAKRPALFVSFLDVEEVVPNYNLIAGSMYHDSPAATKYFCGSTSWRYSTPAGDSCF
jgi:hypothetical protein